MNKLLKRLPFANTTQRQSAVKRCNYKIITMAIRSVFPCPRKSQFNSRECHPSCINRTDTVRSSSFYIVWCV